MKRETSTYNFDDEGRFEIRNYNWSKPVSSFLPGIAGIWGVPSWCYFVNRGQLVCSLGVEDKDGAILEFISFNQALAQVEQTGFRTFIRMDDKVYEPFRKVEPGQSTQILKISPHELEIEEQNQAFGLNTHVLYFPLVELPLAGLVRVVQITNTQKEACTVEVIDGAARILPYGTTFEHQKVTARHIEALMQVTEISGIPVFNLKQTAADIAEIGEIAGGHFMISQTLSGNAQHKGTIVDPRLVFGGTDQLGIPWSFQAKELRELLAMKQMRANQTPCAFSTWSAEIKPGETLSYSLILGHTPKPERLRNLIGRVNVPSFIAQQRDTNQRVIQSVSSYASTISANPIFDAYCEQTFLDNVIRGGMPLTLSDDKQPQTFQIFGRQNADLERDYHWLELEAAYLSQGNGHYRSVLQNRRLDPWFFPKSGDFVIRQFMDLIQLDGYNPLVIGMQRYEAIDLAKIYAIVERAWQEFDREAKVGQLLKKDFTPGHLALALEDESGLEREALLTVLSEVLAQCRELEIGALHAGFWIDHWLYNLDAIEVFLSIYPDRLVELLTAPRGYTFFDNPDGVQPRALKTFKADSKVRRFDAVKRDLEKEQRIAERQHDEHKVRDQEGMIYRTSLLVKLLCIIANKFAALDPLGIGIEMEADKPGWNDSLNGLPGMFGSSLCQSLSLIRTLRFLIAALDAIESTGINTIDMYQELVGFVQDLAGLAEQGGRQVSVEEKHALWDRRHTLLEAYRDQTRLGVKGSESPMLISQIREFLQFFLEMLEHSFSSENIQQVMHPGDVPFTYLRYEASGYRSLNEVKTSGKIPVEVEGFQRKPVAMFLEGAVHAIRTYPERAQSIYENVRSSALFDRELGMFKISESLGKEPHELGRITAYTPGWLEHASIYTHMTYKWLLELLRAGLHDAFFESLRASLPPFMSPEVYGRSLLENCSFIVSSEYPDVHLHGQGFQPRLSGVTAEWLQIWTIMVAGEHPFRLDENGDLVLCLNPVLPSWLFTEESGERPLTSWDQSLEEISYRANCFIFRFLGHTTVSYHNPSRKPTFGPNPSKVLSCNFNYVDGRELNLLGGEFSGQIALDVRNGLVRTMLVELG